MNNPNINRIFYLAGFIFLKLRLWYLVSTRPKQHTRTLTVFSETIDTVKETGRRYVTLYSIATVFKC